MSNFQNALLTEIDDIITLPLLHTCDAHGLRKILQTMELVPQKCDVFDSKLLYTYYGIPSYRINYTNATVNPAYYPVCLILESSSIDEMYKVYPFDSGAFFKKESIKKNFFHHDTEIVDFELEANIKSAKKVIKTFYNSNENYINEKPNVSKKFNLFDFEAEGYKNLISNPQNSDVDNRASSIEIIFNTKISLTDNTVKQIIMPNCFQDDEVIMKLLHSNFNISCPIGYDLFRGIPREFYALIRTKYLDFLNN